MLGCRALGCLPCRLHWFLPGEGCRGRREEAATLTPPLRHVCFCPSGGYVWEKSVKAKIHTSRRYPDLVIIIQPIWGTKCMFGLPLVTTMCCLCFGYGYDCCRCLTMLGMKWISGKAAWWEMFFDTVLRIF